MGLFDGRKNHNAIARAKQKSAQRAREKEKLKAPIPSAKEAVRRMYYGRSRPVDKN